MKLKPIKISINGKNVIVWESPLTLAELSDLGDMGMSEEWKQGAEGQFKYAIMDGMSFNIKKKETAVPFSWVTA